VNVVWLKLMFSKEFIF